MPQLPLAIAESLQKAGYHALTEIQEKSLDAVATGADVVARSPPGTGKTAAFVIPIVSRMLATPATRALVLEPSRELTIQAANETRKIIGGTGIITVAAYGGTNPARQEELIAAGAQIIVATPQRAAELIQDGVLKPGTITVLVLDEADRHFSKEFIKHVEHIASRLPPSRQTLFYSVQMPAPLLSQAQANGIIKFEVTIIKSGGANAKTVSHYYLVTGSPLPTISKLIKKDPVKSIVFCKSAEAAEEAFHSLRFHGLNPLLIHSGRQPEQRHSAVKRFLEEPAGILVATDLAARGMHFPLVKKIFNYGLPANQEFFLHRAGRSGRMGELGECITLVSVPEFKDLKHYYEASGLTASQLEFNEPVLKKTKQQPHS